MFGHFTICMKGLIYNDKKYFFEESVCIHNRNLRALSNEIYEIYNGISTTSMNELFTLRYQNQYNLRNWPDFHVPKVRTVNHGSESVGYLGPKIWEIIATYIKELDTTDKFEIAIEKWKADYYLCRLRLHYRLEHKFVALFAQIL